MNNKYLVSFLLRIGLVIAFLYAAVASFLDPNSWIGFLPQWLRNIFPANLLLIGFSVYEVGLSLWLLAGKKTFPAAIFSIATMLGIIIVNMRALDIVFRDVAIMFMAIALAVLSKSKSETN